MADFLNELLNEGKKNEKGFGVNNFRSSLAHGVAEPTLFDFTLKEIPETIRKQFNASDEKKNFLSNLNNIQEYANIGLDVAKNFIPKAYDVSAYYNQGMSTLNNLFGKSPQQTIKDLTFRVTRTSIPDRTLETYPIKYYGIQYTNPRDISPNYLTINIMSSENYWEHYFFSVWMANIVDYGHSNATYDVDYYDDIISYAEIQFYNTENDPTYYAMIDELYPISVQGVDGDWSRKDSINNFNVTFAYKTISVKMNEKSNKSPLEKMLKTGIGVANQFGAKIPSGVNKTIGTLL